LFNTTAFAMARPIYNNILETIGDTPIVRLNRIPRARRRRRLRQDRDDQPGNSIKDRMAVKMIEDAEKAAS
jgi:cystathionine beta-synthase